SHPPQLIISAPVHSAASESRPVGALFVLLAVQRSVLGLYLPPVFSSPPSYPPHTTISVPVQTAVCDSRPVGALLVLVGTHVSVPGVYLPPVLEKASA